MNGIDRYTGKGLSGMGHLKQSLQDILTTPIGSRVMRREYGSQLFALLDAPINRETMLHWYAAVAEAVLRWEPRFALNEVKIVSVEAGRVVLDLTGQYLPEGKQVRIEGMVIA